MGKDKKNEQGKGFRNVAERLWQYKWTKLLLIVIVLIISFLLYKLGVKNENIIAEGVFGGIFTAMIVTIVEMCGGWNTETEIEKSFQKLEQATSDRIGDMQKIIDFNCKQLENTANSLDSDADKLTAAVSALGGEKCFFCKNNIERICMNRESCDLQSFFESAQHSISILATNLDSFKNYTDVLNKMAAKGVDVRITTMHPIFAREFFKLRVLGNQSPEEAWDKMKSALDLFLSHLRSDGYKLKLYSGILPTLVLIIADDRCYVAYLLNDKKTRDTIHFLFGNASYNDTESPVHYFKEHFESTWNHKGTKFYTKKEIASIQYNSTDYKWPLPLPTDKQEHQRENDRKEATR